MLHNSEINGNNLEHLHNIY